LDFGAKRSGTPLSRAPFPIHREIDTTEGTCHKEGMNRFTLRACFALFSLLFCLADVGAEDSAPPKQGAALLKTDILGVFAHPDDETGVAATLAFYAHGRNAVVANVYCTRGESGGNMVGTQWGTSLGILREAELRDCLSTIGVRYCYFLDQLDWAYTESVSATLDKWGKEQTLEKLVRLVRALRPEVIVTMNPAPTPGQHGHHQAAGVLATEAFSAAADPTRFPLQISKEGLTPWQPRRLFYSGGSTNQIVATIAVNDPLPDGRTPAQLAGRALANHRSQAFGNFSDSPWLRRPQRFLLVKGFVPNTGLDHDLLGGLPSNEIAPVELAPANPADGVTLRFRPRPAVSNYEQWVREQHIEHVAAQFQPDLSLVRGEAGEIEVELVNGSSAALEGELEFEAPPGWRIEAQHPKIRIDRQQNLRLPARLFIPESALNDEDISVRLTSAGEPLKATTRIHTLPRARATKTMKVPPLDGSADAWKNSPGLEITPEQIVQGKVADATDSSASFRLAHNGKTLFIDVQVRDNVIVTNIAPNDIRGHWRSDSVEICIDPAVGSEHTMGCYKIGVFPWDSTGVVRAARDADANQGPIEETAPGTRIASSRTADGYRVQAAIPFSEIGLKKGQSRLGFNLIIYDGDKADAAPGENINKSRIAWAPRSGVQGRPEDWGRIDLE
jgi:LmbE family N-acetylglucosaminyl deacetylase